MGDPARRTVRLDDLIFKATDALLIGPDYAAIMQICDVLNNRKERVPLAVGVLKDRLKHREKDVVLRTLELLDAVTKNVPESIQYVGARDFLSVLRKMVTNKKTEFLVKETMLAYIQSCALAFKHRNNTHFGEVYDALRKEGVSFPPPEKEAEKLFRGAASTPHSPKAALQQQQQRQASTLTGWSSRPEGSGSPPAVGRKQDRTASNSGGRGASKEEKLLLAFSSAGVLGLEQELSLLQNSIDLAEDILRNARSKLDLQGGDVFSQVFSSCQSALPQVQSLLAVPSPPMTEDMVAALLYANDRLLAVQSLHQALVTGERSLQNTRSVAISSDEESSSSSDDDDDTQYQGMSRGLEPSQHHVSEPAEAVPQLLRAPPKARTSNHPQPQAQQPSRTALNAAIPTPPLGSSEDILDEFAALALRHTPPPAITSISATPPLQPYPMAFPYTLPAPAPAYTLPALAPASTLSAGPATNPFLITPPPTHFTSPPPAYTSIPYLSTPSVTTPGTGGAAPLGQMHAPPTYYQATPPSISHAQFLTHTQLSSPPGWSVPPTASSSSSSIQDDFDLLFGKH